ncbi:MAG: peroxide stress protein YaaA, partial [Psychrosphaera sp.]|nr:peroxide stress protein YaaA [Psychrosphaera sp.]
MLIVVSPAKNLDYETAPATEKHSQPQLLDHANELMTV